MNTSQKLYVVLPAFNEGLVIDKVLNNIYNVLKAADFTNMELIIVNDGSKDNTAQLVTNLLPSLPIKLLQHSCNLGLGAALKTGLLYAIKKSNENDIILTTESDGTQNADKLPILANGINEGADFGVATPHISKGRLNVPFHRQILSQGANILYRVLFPIKGLHDYTNLVRGMRASFLKKGLEYYGEDAFFDRTGFESVPDLILKLRIFHPKIFETPVLIDFAQKEKESSMDIAKTIFYSLKLCGHHLTKKAVRN